MFCDDKKKAEGRRPKSEEGRRREERWSLRSILFEGKEKIGIGGLEDYRGQGKGALKLEEHCV
jgi:hypothetical protein